MYKTKISIAKLMLVVLVFALDATWARRVMFGGGSIAGFDSMANGHIFDLGIIGMVTMMALSWIWPGPSDADRRGFFVGLQVFGMLAMLNYWVCCRQWGDWYLPEPPNTRGWGLIRVGTMTTALVRAVGLEPIVKVGNQITNPWVFAVWTALLTLPMVVFAWIGGILTQRVADFRNLARMPPNGSMSRPRG
jgi:hypothetical protein